MQAHAQVEVNWLFIGGVERGRQFGEEQTQCPCRGFQFVQAGASGVGEYGLTSLIVPKVSTSRRTTQGCAISIWSILNVGLCRPYLLITVS